MLSVVGLVTDIRPIIIVCLMADCQNRLPLGLIISVGQYKFIQVNLWKHAHWLDLKSNEDLRGLF